MLKGVITLSAVLMVASAFTQQWAFTVIAVSIAVVYVLSDVFKTQKRTA